MVSLFTFRYPSIVCESMGEKSGSQQIVVMEIRGVQKFQHGRRNATHHGLQQLRGTI